MIIMKGIVSWCCIVFLSILLISCHSIDINHQDAHIRGKTAVVHELEIPYQPEKVTSNYQVLAKHNALAMSWYQAHEKKFYRDDTHNFPKTCLALSGGGIRAAAHSLGVMKGLAEKEILQQVDIISAVSGGAYALSWFYTQQSDGNITEQIFTEPEYINALALEANMYNGWDFAQSLVLDTVHIPYNFLVNGIFGLHINSTPGRANYEHEIRKLFQGGERHDFEEVSEWIEKHDLPYFIINATVKIEEDMFHLGSKLSNSIFEFTPLRFGSDALGYGYAKIDPDSDTDTSVYPFDFSRAVSVSGAAADSSAIPGNSQKVIVSFFNHDLGYNINNYNDHYKENSKTWTKVLPLPFYYFGPHYLRDKNGSDMYLTDGGHSENLGVFSLARRGCETIYVVDSEFDPNYTFEGYFKLQQALKNEMGVDLRISDIDVIERQVVCREEGDSGCLGTTEVNGQREFDRGVSVMEGSISAFPLVDPDTPNVIKERNLNVIYIKLGIDEDLMQRVIENPEVVQHKAEAIRRFGEEPVNYFMKSQAGDCGNIFLKCAFPQYSTVDQSYTAEQFMAYVDLGYHNVKNSPLIAQ